MTYGVKKSNGSTTMILTAQGEFLSHRFVGIGAAKEKEWKTRKGAARTAQRFGGEVFTITNNVMNY